MATYLMDPTVPKADKAGVLTSSLKETSVSVQTANFMGALAENGRLGELYKVADDFKDLVRAHNGQVQAIVTSAIPLDADQVVQLKKALTTRLKKGQTLQLEDKRIDMSVVTRVKRMSDAIRTAFS